MLQSRTILQSNNNNNMQDDVREFMEACHQTIGDRPGLRDQLLRIRLITEEPMETARAIYSGDLIETIDGLVDSLYVIFGTGVAIGVDLLPFWREVHRANMAKRGPDGIVHLDKFGKVTKPPGWTPPDIEGVFRKFYGDPADFPAEPQSHDHRWHEVITSAIHNGITPELLLECIKDRSWWGDDNHG